MKNLIYLFLLLPSVLWGQKNIDYSFLLIPAKLTENANAIVRLNEEVFTIQNIGKATSKHKYVCTVLNQEGDKHAELRIDYSSFRSVSNISGKLYDRMGKVVDKLKKTEITDVNTSNYAEIGDARIKVAKFNYNTYPYTVEFEYEIEYNGLLFYPSFMPHTDIFISIEKAVFKVIAPASHQFFYKEYNMPTSVQMMEEKGKKSYTWILENLPSIKPEYYSIRWYEQVPWVNLSPKEFEMDKYKGKMDSWESLGFFSKILNENRQEIPEKTKEKLKELTENANSDYEKIKIIYNYMQSKTRYISVQLGIGGWQPMLANLVDSKGYGDCKALSNYTHALLGVVGIKSYYTLISAGKDFGFPIDTNFPNRNFNHVILCVPIQKDTVWLECTSQQQPTGFLGDFTDDRYALLITENGGKLVRTPKYTMQDNQLIRKAEIIVGGNGESKATIKTKYSNLEYDELIDSGYITGSQEEQRKYLYEAMNIAKFDIISLNLKEDKSRKPSLEESLEIKIDQIGAKNGKRIFFTPNLFNKFSMPLPDYKERKTDIVLPFRDFEHQDEVRFTIPANFQMEGNFETVNLTSSFGAYSISLTKENNVLVYKRNLQVKSGRYPKEKYQEFLDFFRKIDKYDKLKAVLVSQ